MIRRSVAAVTIAAALVLTGCAPEPDPTPTPTGFASDEEAFAAAEATYRAYVDALNEVDLADPATFEPVFEYLSGDALDSAKKSFTQMHADGWQVSGPSEVATVTRSTWDPSEESAVLAVCVDVSAVLLVDADGNDQTGDRPTEQSLLVTVDRREDAWKVSDFSGRTGAPECES